MIRICSKCGALLLDKTEKCSFCDIPIEEGLGLPSPVAATSREVESAEPEPEWRREVSRRLHEYRVRRGRAQIDECQSGLPFRDVHEEISLDPPQSRVRPRQVSRQRQVERVEICIQPELDFSSSPGDRAHPQTALVPVAGLPERRLAGFLDAIFLCLTCAGFIGLFLSLHGQISLAKTDAVVYLVAVYLFYALYFFVFTTLAGATPGMQLRGLTVVRLDGSLPDTRQLLWRSFGYLLSGGTLMMGFLWAIWDEDHFTWQDRISQTYVTAATPMRGSEPVELQPGDLHAGRHSLVRR